MNNKKHRILIVDDEPSNLQLMRQLLSADYQLSFASSGLKAIEIAGEVKPALILLDIMMPEMDGYETCRQLKSIDETKDTPVIFVTAKGDESEETKGFEVGAVDYITKPIKPQILKARVNTHLRLKEINQELAMLNQASQLFNSTLEWQQVLESVLSEMHQLMKIMVSSFWLTDPDTGELICQHATGPGIDKVIGLRLASGTGIVGRTAKTGQIINIQDTRTDERHFKEVSKDTEDEYRSMLNIPFRMKGEVIGVLQLLDKNPGRFTDDVVRFVEPIVSAAASAVQNSRLYMLAQHQKDAAEKARLALQTELKEASNYVQALLPAPKSESIFSIDWRFLPCSELGGDSFGYHWIDNDHFAIYLVDVAGHGVGAALLSVSVINQLRSQAVTGTDFREPRQVLNMLNNAFPGEKQNHMFFTIWYGVYNKNSKKIVYSSGGHPPALILSTSREKITEAQQLMTPNLAIGVLQDYQFQQEEIELTGPSRLYIFSDGVFEITKEDGQICDLKSFFNFLSTVSDQNTSCLDRLVEHAKEMNGMPEFEDDYTIIEITFN
jgi:serine phosphatase RsbU (regulator of sigma subunit)/DNA-binding response OmpR family regulator